MPWLWRPPGRDLVLVSHLEVFWVGMKGRSLILQTEKLGPREELIFPGHIAIWGHNWRLDSRVVSLQTSSALTQKLIPPTPVFRVYPVLPGYDSA